MLLEFLQEVYHDTDGRDTALCLLSPAPMSRSMKRLLKSRFAKRHHITYLQGSVFREHDLNRARVKDAVGCFIFADKCVQGRAARLVEDANAILSAVAVTNIQHDIPLFLSVHSPESLEQASWSLSDGGRGAAISGVLLTQRLLAASTSERQKRRKKDREEERQRKETGKQRQRNRETETEKQRQRSREKKFWRRDAEKECGKGAEKEGYETEQIMRFTHRLYRMVCSPFTPFRYPLPRRRLPPGQPDEVS